MIAITALGILSHDLKLTDRYQDTDQHATTTPADDKRLKWIAELLRVLV
jgi:hypothetical protein